MNAWLLTGVGVVIVSLIAAFLLRGKRAAMSGAIAVAIAGLAPILLAFTPRHADLVVVGVAALVGSLLGAWLMRARQLAARYLLAIAFAAIVPIVIAFLPTKPEHVVEVYVGGLRGSMFAGFLSLGGFLLSLKTFIVVKMKEGVFDHERHVGKVVRARKKLEQDGVAPEIAKRSFTFYGELDRLRSLLFGAIVGALVTAVLQVTLGVADDFYTTTTCFAVAAWEMAVLGQTLLLINSNLHDWFMHLELDAEKKQSEVAGSAAEAEAVKTPVS